MVPVFDLLVLSQIPAVGSNRLRGLVARFGSPDSAMNAPAREIALVDGFSKKLATSVAHFRKSSSYDNACSWASRQLSRLNRAGGRIVSCWDEAYPELLRRIYDPPAFFFIKGTLTDNDRYSIAVVGTRNPSEYGLSLAGRFSHEFARLGITVISGLARGIDTEAHTSALKGGGRSIAVIGSGLDVIYPGENRPLADRCSGNGCIISECEMGAKPDAVNFPRRNRIVSGLSLGTLVIETDINGGAMITANSALDQNREVFAVPGAVTSRRSRGCHALIREGRAKLVESIDDILTELGPRLRPLLKGPGDERKPPAELSLFERQVYDALPCDPCHIDALASRAGLSTSDVLVNLLSLEFKGLVRQLPGKMFQKL
jgi:DNA processing protein